MVGKTMNNGQNQKHSKRRRITGSNKGPKMGTGWKETQNGKNLLYEIRVLNLGITEGLDIEIRSRKGTRNLNIHNGSLVLESL